ncbi:hypothetical protein PHLCEN_2v4194 [Hermanssonia centrifuga]|uniref:Uncharacterized protein n=1 Tax=Hermanssonia centrifuga TaxID=98765 RepID=A0A2R6PZ15_9APHY|nr:hypothetical protein PHLCEN_2v4194 [Hermanssonia centrifuga]
MSEEYLKYRMELVTHCLKLSTQSMPSTEIGNRILAVNPSISIRHLGLIRTNIPLQDPTGTSELMDAKRASSLAPLMTTFKTVDE